MALKTMAGMSSPFRFSALGLALTMAVPGYAASLSSILNTATATGTDTSSMEHSILSDAEQVRARTWHLSEPEWQRYRQLMQGIRGSISPETISPIEVLGIHSRDEAERQRYAERWAQTMHEDAERILVFQYAYDEAIRRLYPGESLIDSSRLPEISEKTDSLEQGDRVLFFTRADCPACDALFRKVLQRIDDVAGIDIYISSEKIGDDKAVRDWAKDHGINPEWVRSRRVTLNHDAGALEQLTHGEGQIPYLMRRRGEDVSPLRVSDL
jgi:integrating conjugative element protein (TIGR03759 family)